MSFAGQFAHAFAYRVLAKRTHPRSTLCLIPNDPGDVFGEGESLIEKTSIVLYFEEAFLGGSMTCNGYGRGPDSGKYVAADDGTLTVAWPLAVTVQLCSSPEGIMEQEAAYIEALQSAAIYRVADHRLEIDDTAGEMILVFAKKRE